MKLSAEEARDVIWGDSEDWKAVSDKQIEDQRCWVTVFSRVFQRVTVFSRVFQHIPSGKYYEFCWEKGSTEYQEQQPFEYEEFVEPVEVHKVAVTVEKWMPVEG